jgi:predicted neuraminidase
VYNPQQSGRDRLRMASSLDGTLWSSMVELENGPPGSEYSYPAMAWVDGQVWVSYTDQRQSIAWQRFAWVSQARAAPDKGRP